MSDIRHTFVYSRTQIGYKEYWTDTMKWTLHNFADLVDKKMNINFYSEESDMRYLKHPETRLRLKIQWNGRTSDVKIYYFLPTPAVLSYKVSLDSEESKVVTEQNNHRIAANKWHYMTTIIYDGRTICLRTGHKERYYYDFIIRFKFNVSFNEIQTNDLDQLSNNLQQLFLDPLFSDVVMKSAEGTEFKVHKNILASRSAVLKAHFAHDTTETYTNIVESPFKADVLKEVLTFIYSNKAPKAGEIPDKLLEAADYYQLDGLNRLCTQKLYERLTAENAIDTLQLADRHHADSLKQLTLMYIKDRAGKITKETGGWAKVESVTLLKYTCDWLMQDDDTVTEEKEE